MPNKNSKLLFWLPRILTILFILFMSMFALDVFSEYKFPEVLVALFMHLIPSFVLIILLIIAWKWDRIGGIIFLILGIIFTYWFKLYRDPISFLIVGMPVFAVGILFLLNYYLSKRKVFKRKHN